MYQELTDQEIFDRVWTHFIVDKAPYGVLPGGRPTYCTPEGARCAVGIFIEDEDLKALQRAEMDCISVQRLWGGAVGPLRRFLAGHVTLFERLQRTHDQAAARRAQPEDFARDLRNVADAFGLKVPS